MRIINALKWTAVTVTCAGIGVAWSKEPIRAKSMIGPMAPSAWPSAATQPAASQPIDVPEMHMHTPAETLAMTRVQPGYHLELVASEPNVISPVCLAWDGDGRMYVAEMRSYMLDLNGSHEKDLISRVSRFEDTKGDGHYDKQTLFADHLLLPRAILPLDDRIIIRETDSKNLYSYRDTTGSGTADEKVLLYTGGKEPGNLEHQPSGLIWNLDNWIYVTHDTTRLRFTRGQFETDKHGISTGQWGIATDDVGRLIYATAGTEQPAHDFQVPPPYGKIELPGELVPGYTEVFPLLPMTDVQGGPNRVKAGGGLTSFTACGGGSIYRGDTLPADLYGDYILPEPVGRLIRRSKVTNVDGKIVLSNAYDGQEFIASTDANFRPIWSATGPDGCIYICDMYHGIIQESQWTMEGSYLRPQIQKYGLHKNINGGRIYRLVHDGMKRRERPHMLSETSAQLVKHLGDPNGWWRDTAQKLIILRDEKSIIPTLREMTMNAANPLERLHALWTLEGMDAADRELIVAKLADTDPRLRAVAIRLAEPIIARDDPEIMKAVGPLAMDADPNVAEQFCISLIYTKHPHAEDLVRDCLAAREKSSLKLQGPKAVVNATYEAIAKAKRDAEKQAQLAKRDPKLAATIARGKDLYAQTCIACHGPDGRGTAAPDNHGTLAPPLAGSRRLTRDKLLVGRIVLRGLVGPHDNGKTYPNEMASFAWADDEWLSSILTYARQAWGNTAGPITPTDLARVRQETEARVKPYTILELEPKAAD